MGTKRILVPTDFSPFADQAAGVALDWAKRFGGELHWAHAIEHLPHATPPSAQPLISTYLDQARSTAEEKLKLWVERAFVRGLSAESHLLNAPVGDAIVELAKEIEAEYVILGTRGHTRLGQILLGSAAEQIARDVRCSVLIVRGERSPLDPGVILLGDDLSPRSTRAREEANRLALALGARIDVIHAPEVGIPYPPSLDTPVLKKVFKPVINEAREKLEALAAETPDIAIESDVVAEKPAAALCARAEREGAGLVVVGSHSLGWIERSLLGSVAGRVVRHAPCSVLVVR